MSCCGSRRAALRTPALRGTHYVAPATAPDASAALLGYRGPVPMALSGPVSAKVYKLRAAGPVSVDARDAPALLRTGWFTVSAG